MREHYRSRVDEAIEQSIGDAESGDLMGSRARLMKIMVELMENKLLGQKDVKNIF